MQSDRNAPTRLQRFPRGVRAGANLPTLPGFLRWTYDVAFLVFVVAAIFYFVAAFGEGGTFLERLGDSYTTIINATTNGTTWTQIMRENQLYLIVPGAILLVLLGWALPRDYTGRANFLVITFALGFLFGHVFWGS